MDKMKKEEKQLLRLGQHKFQFFADGGNGQESTDEGELETPVEEKVTLTQKELQAKIDSEKDKHANKVWETKSAKLREELLAEIEKEKEKEKELEKLSSDEKAQRLLDEREAKLKELETKLEHEKQLSQVKSDLAEKQLPAEFASIVTVVGDNETTLKNINTIKEYIDKAVNEAKDGSARQVTPRGTNGGKPSNKQSLNVFGNEKKNSFSERAKKQYLS